MRRKKRYSKDNKAKIEERSKELLKFFIEQEKEMKSVYNEKIEEKNKLIEKINDSKEDKLFNLFTLDEKINYIKIGKKI